jgi:hypothetical protein
MTREPVESAAQVLEYEWVGFPGGELEGKRPKTLCLACRAAVQRQAATGSAVAVPSSVTSPSRPLCFQCYRADLDRERALKAAGELDTASDARFQSQLPFEPVNRARLQMLKVERSAARASAVQDIGQYQGTGPYAAKRRQAQIAARHALQAIATGLKARTVAPVLYAQALASAAHAAELQLPEAWLPFVVSR